MTRRWQAGARLELGGLKFRIVQGAKSPTDLRVDWLTPQGGRAVPMAAAGFLTDFFFENEEVLYPRANGADGGRYLLEYLYEAAQWGWETADRVLQVEKENAEAKRNGKPPPHSPVPPIAPYSFIPPSVRDQLRTADP